MSTKTILLVDDNPDEAVILREMLGSDYSVESVQRPELVDSMMAEFSPDCVLIDFNLGTMYGTEVLTELVAQDYAKPVAFVMLTGHDSRDIAVQCMQLGAHDFLVKDLGGWEALLRAVERAMNNATLEFQVRKMAYEDDLTGLLNRKSFWDRLEQRCAQRGEQSFGVLNIDLDRFKSVNDSHGHKTGDEVLSIVADRLQTIVSPEDSIARMGGDEFLVLIDRATSRAEVIEVANRVRDSLAEPLELDRRVLSVTPSVGVAMFPFDGREPDELISNSDLAMYDVKRNGRNGVREFDDRLSAESSRRMQIERSLGEAVRNNEFFVHYQPVVDATGEVVGLEALLRWDRPGHGLQNPAVFLDILEETGLIVPVGYQVLDQVCARCRAWADAGIAPLRVHINVSPRQFQDPALEYTLKSTVERYQLDTEWLSLEITESSMIRGFDECVRTLQQWRDLGIRIAIDDFGMGYSSLSYLKRLPVDILKIDRSFVSGLPEDAGDRAIVKAIISLAKDLDLELIAEGVENTEQQFALQEYGCELFQGYLFGRPAEADSHTHSLLNQSAPPRRGASNMKSVESVRTRPRNRPPETGASGQAQAMA